MNDDGGQQIRELAVLLADIIAAEPTDTQINIDGEILPAKSGILYLALPMGGMEDDRYEEGDRNS